MIFLKNQKSGVPEGCPPFGAFWRNRPSSGASRPMELMMNVLVAIPVHWFPQFSTKSNGKRRTRKKEHQLIEQTVQ
jgi:hypothetical protein